jgi:hypothetical protein
VEIVDPNSHHTFFANPVIIYANCYLCYCELDFSLLNHLGHWRMSLGKTPHWLHVSLRLFVLQLCNSYFYLPFYNFRKSSDPDGDWWELWDDKTNLPYYYHTHTCATEWTKPMDKQVVSLIKIQVIRKSEDSFLFAACILILTLSSLLFLWFYSPLQCSPNACLS